MLKIEHGKAKEYRYDELKVGDIFTLVGQTQNVFIKTSSSAGTPNGGTWLQTGLHYDLAGFVTARCLKLNGTLQLE